MLKFVTTNDLSLDAASVEGLPSRSITGLAAPYGVEATVSDGTRVILEPGALITGGRKPKLYMAHDSTKAIGLVTERVDSPEGMYFTATISATRLGDEALVLAADGVLDSVSVGINPTAFTYDDQGVMHVTAATFDELSLVTQGAWSAAQISQVAATPPTTNSESEAAAMADPIIPEPEPVTIPTAPLYPTPKREFRMPSSGEYLAAMHIGGDTFRNMNEHYVQARKASQTMLEAAAGDIITTDTPGLLPVPVLGPLVQNLNFIRPVINAIGARAYPDNGQSKTFVRPTITTHTSVATQSTELSAVSATTMVIASNTVSKTTLAGQVTLSEQDVDFTNPAGMELILTDLLGEAMIASDDFCADALLAAATTSGVWDLSVTDLMKSIYDAAVDISATRNFFPTHIFVDPATWGLIGQLVDTTGRPIFPAIGSSLQGFNTLGAGDATSWSGQNPLGLQMVVDGNFAAKTMVITKVGTGFGDAFEYYEQQKGLMSIQAPSTLGRVFSTHMYVSTFAAIPGMIRKITQA
ncbi:hypothetical protein UFOVP1208_15 [uncultured Caudovirales phage]|uniref:Prohead protease n=1 Tax=uncultured Caudovirales phage TaxID=2100421 RepID=A0A6J5PY02_9CAUD|nr:hypothetical protein UFOVP980_8 [uncultured Caudovirales phage]CAB4189672.1 hypothetical protein UFOVP1208_15 [uncultured Caudovirales phage]CAB4194042.1 hypothetical protein UFOVP1263_3 [uncultured Caudovirales phage]